MHNAGVVAFYYIFAYAHHKRARAQSELNLDFGHFYLVHAQSTKLIELGCGSLVVVQLVAMYGAVAATEVVYYASRKLVANAMHRRQQTPGPKGTHPLHR